MDGVWLDAITIETTVMLTGIVWYHNLVSKCAFREFKTKVNKLIV